MNDPEENKTCTEKDNADKAHTRWVDIALTQLGYSINLILAFSLASIGFGVSLWGGQLNPQLCLYVVALVFLFFSILFGIGCTVTRLCDFRKTRKMYKLERDNCYSAELERLKKCTATLGKWTWYLFELQLVLFMLGFICLAISIIIPIIWPDPG